MNRSVQSVYNDLLVRRGEIFLDFSILEDWDKEVRWIIDRRRETFHTSRLLN